MSAELLGIPAEIEHGGKIYRLGPANGKSQGILQELLAVHAVKSVTSLKMALPPATYSEMLSEVTRQVGSGQFKTGTPGWISALATPDGTNLFYLSLFRVNHPDMTIDECTEIVVAHPDECMAAMARIAPGFFDSAFPNAPAEARTTYLEQMESFIKSKATKTS